MYLRELHLTNFRNFSHLCLAFNPRINRIIGENGQGKSNLLESIYCLGLVRSFRGGDAELLKIGAESFEIFAKFENERHVIHNVAIQYAAKRKQVFVNRKRLNSHAALVGRFPVVLFSPEDHRLTSGTPAERRKFIDVLLSQASQQYLKNLQDYLNVLKQRNRLLKLVHDGHAQIEEVETWESPLARIGAEIVAARTTFLSKISDALRAYYAQISHRNGVLRTAYLARDERTLAAASDFMIALRENRKKEILLQKTCIGPHLDDIQFIIDERDVRKQASRGEQKSVLLSLKIMEHAFLREKTGTDPLLLIDDFHSELDEGRQRNAIEILTKSGQVFLTSTNLENMPAHDASTYLVKDGTVMTSVATQQ